MRIIFFKNTSEDDNDDDTHTSEYDAELNQDIREDEVRAAIKKNLRIEWQVTRSRLCVGRALEKLAGNCSPFLDKLF